MGKFQWDCMINYNENENDNEKQIVLSIDLDVDMNTNIQNVAYLGKFMFIFNKLHLSNIWGLIHSKYKQHWGWAEKMRCL